MEQFPLYTVPNNPYAHEKNKGEIGSGRVFYAEAVGLQPAGWHLPGMRITTNEFEALAVATEIDRLLTQARVLPNEFQSEAARLAAQHGDRR